MEPKDVISNAWPYFDPKKTTFDRQSQNKLILLVVHNIITFMLMACSCLYSGSLSINFVWCGIIEKCSLIMLCLNYRYPFLKYKIEKNWKIPKIKEFEIENRSVASILTNSDSWDMTFVVALLASLLKNIKNVSLYG